MRRLGYLRKGPPKDEQPRKVCDNVSRRNLEPRYTVRIECEGENGKIGWFNSSLVFGPQEAEEGHNTDPDPKAARSGCWTLHNLASSDHGANGRRTVSRVWVNRQQEYLIHCSLWLDLRVGCTSAQGSTLNNSGNTQSVRLWVTKTRPNADWPAMSLDFIVFSIRWKRTLV